MNYEVIFTEAAHQDFYAILDYIADDSPHNALKLIDKLQDRTKKTLATIPFGGISYKENIRFFVFDNYIVMYEPNETTEQVVYTQVTWKCRVSEFTANVKARRYAQAMTRPCQA